MQNSYDVIVLGLGGVGSAAAFSLAKRGWRVLGIDQFAPPHQLGSSHGETRIIRKSYFEHPSYVPLLCRAYDLWRELESRSGKRLLHLTGLLELGPPDGIVIPGVIRSATQFELPIEQITMAEARHRFPALQGDDSWSVIFERDAGYLVVEACVQAHLNCAVELGAELVMNRKVLSWQPNGTGVSVTTTEGTFLANTLVIAAGPWARELLDQYAVPLQVLHKHLYWYETKDPSYCEEQGFPCFFYETPVGHFYGFPKRDELGLKVAQHSGGDPAGHVLDGRHHRNAQDQAAVERFLHTNLPNVTRRLTRWNGCYYTMTPDENFIVDKHPFLPQVALVAGLSGHGFKFTSVLGELAADLATDQSISTQLDFLKLSRFAGPPANRTDSLAQYGQPGNGELYRH